MNCYRCATPIPENSRFCLSCGADVSGETAERTQAVDADPELQKELQAELGTDFLIERELGRGGMAVVFLATDVHLGRKVAVKVLPPEFTRLASGGMVERFKREARTSATLDHPHVIPIFRVSTGGKLFWYVMKYLEGEALDDILKREPQLPFARTADILKQTADALGYAHRKNVIHRDVKPANVMLDENGWVTVTDFGIAKALDTSSLTGSGSMIGTPYYMSPEQCSGTKVTGASDQYSLAVMAYQMVGGHLPFTGETVVEIIKKHCMEPPPPLGVLRPATPPALVAVVERALSKSPEDRFPSVVEFAGAFENATGAAGLKVAERPAEALEPRQRPSETALASPLPVVPLPVVPMAPVAEPARRKRRWLLPSALGAVTIAGGLGVALWRPWAPGAGGGLPSAAIPPAGEGARAAPAESVRAGGPLRSDSASPLTPAAPAAAAPSAAPALLVLRGMPAGASATVDGRTARGSRLALSPGTRHVVRVTAAGFESWADTLWPQAGDTIRRTVTMRAVAAQLAAQTPPPVQQQGLPTAAQPSQAGTPGLTAFISVGSRPLATLTVNGQSVPNPASRYQVPAGPVRLHFVVTDSTGIWPFDTTVTVAAGESRNLGRIPLVRRP